ncbi:MAG: NADH-quinone oxidoreductase subunit J [Bacteroidetes bacterium]|nr:NADH-quinone oxidoreductase subunit J [Bacteroidota bacterium]
MILESIVLIVLSILAIGSAVITVANKNPIKSALALVFHFFMLAGIYITLSAQFLAVMQVIVYAGAIMVLVLFVIMLLSTNEVDESKKIKNKIKQSFAIVISIAMLIVILIAILFANNEIQNNTIIANSIGSVEAIGEELYSKFLFPLEIVGILLLSAIIGAVMLAKKKL